jgi:hypothetical protein
VNLFLTVWQGIVFHHAMSNSKQCIIGTDFYIESWFDFRPALPDKNVA